MGIITRLLSIGIGIAAGAAALKLLKKQEQNSDIFELSEKDYIELPISEEAEINYANPPKE